MLRYEPLWSSTKGPRRRSWLRSLIIATVLPISLAAALPLHGSDFLIETWLTNQGLPQNSITSIAQTKDGYLWVGTRNAGLARYDGVRFTSYTPLNTPVLDSFEILRLSLTNEGGLIVTDVNGSLINYENGTFRRMPRSLRSPGREWISASMAIPDNRFVDATRRPLWPGAGGPWEVDRDGKVWFRDDGGGLSRSDNGVIEKISTDGLPGERVHCIAMDSDGKIWVGTDGGIGAWNGARFVDMTPPGGPDQLSVIGMAFNEDGGLWLDTGDRLLKCKDREWLAESPPLEQNFGALTDHKRWLHGDAQGGAWLINFMSGVFHADSKGGGGAIRYPDLTPVLHVNGWFQDRESNIWLALEDGGLLRLRRAVFETVAYGEPHHYRATSVCEDKDGNLWFGTSNGQLLRRRDGQLERVSGNFNDAVAVYPSRNGGIWSGSVTGGLAKVNGDHVEPMSPSSGFTPAIRTLMEDSAGRLWVGGDHGIFRWDGGTFSRIDDSAEGATHVFALAEGPDGEIWYGRGDSLLGRIFDDTVEIFEPHDRNPLIRFWSLTAAADGVVWIGTLGGGLLRFKDGEFVRFTTEDGLPTDTICQIVDDGLGWLWLGGRSGIIRVNKASLEERAMDYTTTLQWLSYGREDGLSGQEVASGTSPGAWAGRDGRIWFATSKGATSFNPSEISGDPMPPLVHIEQISMDGYSQIISSRTSQPTPYQDGAGKIPWVEILSGNRHLEIQYTGLSFVAVDQLRFRYRMEGLHDSWVEAGARRTANFHNLPPGNYVFRVQASNRGGAWSGEGAALAMTVLPHLWQTLWFRGAITVLILSMMMAGVRLRERQVARRKLEELERERAVQSERARIARDIHDDLGASLTCIVALSDSACEEPGISPRMMDSLKRIHSTACDLTFSLSETVWAVSPKHDRLDSLVDYIESFAQECLANAGITCRFRIDGAVPSIPLGAQVRHNVFLAFKEAINNIVKHSMASEVCIALSLSQGGFTLQIEDNGETTCPVIPSAGLPPSPENIGGHGGHGIPNMRTRLALIGGRCEIGPGVKGGTSIEFHVPANGINPLSTAPGKKRPR